MKKIVTRKVSENIPLLHDNPLLHQLYAARGVTDSLEFNYDLSNLLTYDSLKGVSQAVAVLVDALKEKKRILILGDFDTDGATSTALAVLALRAFGHQDVSYLIPDRFKYGYGLSTEIVKVAAKQDPYLIVTVDNGISNIEGVDEANRLGIKVLITDHHLPGERLPAAAAIVNPNQHDDQFPGKNLAGVGVIFYLMLALRAHLRDTGWFKMQNIKDPSMSQFLDLVVLGTVADAVKLDFNNRILVDKGLKRIQDGNVRLGVKSLFAVAKRNYKKASVYDLGFVIAPRLNASGRLDNMSLGVECLLTDDPSRSRSIAKELNLLNDERRQIESDMQKEAMRILDNFQMAEDLPAGISIFEESWHQGVLGILASRLKDKFNRPVVAFTSIGENELKGSVRSVDGVHLRNVLDSIATKNPGLIVRFGGHAMAAGLNLKRENYEIFAQVFADEVSRHLSLEELKGVIHTDGVLPCGCLNLDTAELLYTAGPWGAGFPEPLFFDEFILVNQRLVGVRHLKLVLRHLGSPDEINAICFNIDPDVWPNPRISKAKMVYRLSVNEYNGRRSLQLIINEIVSYE